MSVAGGIESLEEAPRRELRFGLVLYGGVSLAIYIYGVVYEFWRLVRASSGRERNEYSPLLEELGLRATVDIVSGTSAGGINGVLLAKALATGAGMDVVRSLWVDQGDFLKLLRDPSDREPRSLLRSELFDQLVRTGLDDMDRTGDDRPLVDVLDLFVPATRLRPWVRPYRDFSGVLLTTGDYRKIFQLKFRTQGFNPADRELGYHRNDFAPAANELLAEVARATSAFPFAFEPRLIERREPEDPRFTRDEPAATYFSDGGILHNKPFTEAIETIYARAAFWPVSRWLISVEPDPAAGASQQAPGVEPEVIEVVGNALIGIPRSETIADDLERLGEHRVRVQRSEALFRRLENLVDLAFREDPANAHQPDAEGLLGPLALRAYRYERRRATEAELVDRLLDCAGLDATARPYVEVGLSNYFKGRAEQEPHDRERAEEEQLDEERAKEERLARERVRGMSLDMIDLGFERRRIYRLLTLVDRAPVGDEERVAASATRAQLWAAFERIEQRLWDIFGLGSPTTEALAGLATGHGAAIARAVERNLELVLRELSTLRIGITEEVRAAVALFDLALPPQIAKERAARLQLPWHSLVFVYDNYELWDVFIVVVEHIGGLTERDPIKHRHITPASATYIRKPQEDKLAGDALGHFGGFLKKSWRNNDILWGRLDAAEIIVETLLAERETPMSRPEVVHRIRSVQEPIARSECDLPSNRDYRLFLERDYMIGSEDVADVPAADRAELLIGGSDVLRNMFRRLQRADFQPGLKARGLKGIFAVIGRLLGVGLFLFRWPTRALFGRDPVMRRVATVVLFGGFVWAIATLVLALLGVIPLRALAGTLGTLVAAAIVLYLVYLILLALIARARFAAARRRLEGG